MTESTDDMLTRPLGVPEAAAPEQPSGRLGRAVAFARRPRVTGGAIAIALAATVGLVLALGDPRGGDPRAEASITIREPAGRPAPAAASPPVTEPQVATTAPTPTSLQRSAEEIETASGVTVVRPAGSGPSDAVVIRVPPPSAPRLAPAPDPRITETGRHGVMPKLGEGRARALDVYARAEEAGTGPRIAIVVTGLGVGQAATAGATARLPAAVSLAFVPYGGEAARAAARARDAGHEVFLQLPMEPFDYPDSDPGPQALLTALKGPENADRLAWALARFPGYVGVANFMGSKLMADPAFEPILREIGGRGLGFLDDGTGAKPATAPANKARTPIARAEIVLDATPRADAIDAALAQAEARAKANGFVLVSAGGAALSVDRIARWAKDLDARGLRLVPASVALRGARDKRVSTAD
ncbi:divergent polysaccharide deacetylase family protein [Methylobacterium mesophilicum SR1.6/6]|uniref:Divergent polysaccharide deacetylase family protein n=1 Tax=Methylobacterium mesophilicum SR1.6/6 TaxID=908290 RepID=A0A6B9FIF3_9HYPH|nr:divergent polysaccharide deacetylase family protein [Methylobacterium mesophilicum]QGY01749.1 divergent polysaccharide deacetylase family protein [Methylobacterium mesophilicum SR1.6/6]